jgi:hypothetical protein
MKEVAIADFQIAISSKEIAKYIGEVYEKIEEI